MSAGPVGGLPGLCSRCINWLLQHSASDEGGGSGERGAAGGFRHLQGAPRALGGHHCDREVGVRPLGGRVDLVVLLQRDVQDGRDLPHFLVLKASERVAGGQYKGSGKAVGRQCPGPAASTRCRGEASPSLAAVHQISCAHRRLVHSGRCVSRASLPVLSLLLSSAKLPCMCCVIPVPCSCARCVSPSASACCAPACSLCVLCRDGTRGELGVRADCQRRAHGTGQVSPSCSSPAPPAHGRRPPPHVPCRWRGPPRSRLAAVILHSHPAAPACVWGRCTPRVWSAFQQKAEERVPAD